MRLTDQFVVMELHYTFGVDALETSRPIKQDVTTPSEISRMFDAISYDKGKLSTIDTWFKILDFFYL